MRAVCPECDAVIEFDRPPLRGQVVRCADCGVELEVIGLDPIVLEVAPEVEEDWGE
ncbi:MAG: lysine biosynthesis protein LysW [Planctomycetota bacterium]